MNEDIARDPRLEGILHHGSARRMRQFCDVSPAYLTPNLFMAREYAHMDSEVDGGTGFVATCRIVARNPVRLDITTLQDLHYCELKGFYDYLIARGHDCAVPEDDTILGEVVVFGARGLEVLSFDPIPDRSVWLPELLRPDAERTGPDPTDPA